MTLLETWVHTPAAQALGWALVHSLWQGALAALLLGAAVAILRTSRARYAAACLAMLAMLAGFGLTFARLLPPHRGASTARTLVIPPAPNGPDEPWRAAAIPVQREWLPWLASFWIAGVVLFHLRSLAGWMAAGRLRRTGVCRAPDLWQERLQRLRARLRLTRPVMLLESCLADVPVLIGWLRPVILMPLGLLATLPAGQIEAILLHELAHIRRCDYLVNLLQTFAESLLFYHPAAWWVSGVIRAERENCCDDWVVATHGDAHEYAVALAALEQNRWTTRQAALAATGGGLVKRIRRLLAPPEGPRAAWTPVLSAGILTIAAAIALAAWQAKPSAPPARPAVKLLAQVQQTPAPHPSASPYRKWLDEDAAYIITNPEREAFLRLRSDAERERFIEQFWLRRDPTPGTARNEFKEEHYRRIAYANQRYGTANTPGWKSDRGRIYITFGPPDEIESHPSGGVYTRPLEEGGGQTTTYPFEQWRYRYIEGAGDDIRFEFVDKMVSGDLRMTADPREKETTPYVPGQSGAAVFVSAGPGAQVMVEVSSDRRMRVSIPIDFDAPQYLITGSTWRSGRTEIVEKVQRVVSLCRDAAGVFGCAAQPVFQIGPLFLANPLDPGDYVFEAVVEDRAGTSRKTYTVKFEVK